MLQVIGIDHVHAFGWIASKRIVIERRQRHLDGQDDVRAIDLLKPDAAGVDHEIGLQDGPIRQVHRILDPHPEMVREGPCDGQVEMNLDQLVPMGLGPHRHDLPFDQFEIIVLADHPDVLQMQDLGGRDVTAG